MTDEERFEVMKIYLKQLLHWELCSVFELKEALTVMADTNKNLTTEQRGMIFIAVCVLDKYCADKKIGSLDLTPGN